MNNSFDELTKGMARSVTRRGALKQFGKSLVGSALAFVGLAGRSHAQTLHLCQSNKDCEEVSPSAVCCETMYSGGKVCAEKSWCVQRNKKIRWV